MLKSKTYLTLASLALLSSVSVSYANESSSTDTQPSIAEVVETSEATESSSQGFLDKAKEAVSSVLNGSSVSSAPEASSSTATESSADYQGISSSPSTTAVSTSEGSTSSTTPSSSTATETTTSSSSQETTPSSSSKPVADVKIKNFPTTVAYGVSLTPDQRAIVSKAFGLNGTFTQTDVNHADFLKYLKQHTNVALLSSVMVEQGSKGSGVVVDIKTLANITAITPQQYANAAITAGAYDLKISVASPVQVTGESALTGLYKALELNNVHLDTARTEVAQQELGVSKEISEAQASNQEYNPTLLDGAMAEIKTKLAEYKKKHGNVAEEKAVELIVNQALKTYGLSGILTPEQVTQLVQFAKAYQSTSAVDSKQALKQLGDLQDNVTEKAGDLLKSAKENGVYEKGGNFFKSIWESVKSVFSKD